jgi:hypothetical protein
MSVKLKNALRARPTAEADPVFTVVGLRKILDSVLKQGTNKPSSEGLIRLAGYLNFIHAYRIMANASPVKQAKAERVRDAIQVLMDFFEERKRALGSVDSMIVEREMRLQDQFDSFLRAMEKHDFELMMDKDEGALVPKLENWRDVAVGIASVFVSIMKWNNPKLPFGLSNDGPVPRFVAAVVPLITDENPSVENVAQHLKRQARKRRQPTGTNGK